MKISLSLIILLFASCQMENKNEEKTHVYNLSTKKKGKSILSFEKLRYDFGEINLGDSVSYDFKFKNSGKEPLLISTVTSSCGCTVTSYPKKPVPINGIDSIRAVFFSKLNKGNGMQKKVIYVYSNASEPVISLSLQGIVN